MYSRSCTIVNEVVSTCLYCLRYKNELAFKARLNEGEQNAKLISTKEN